MSPDNLIERIELLSIVEAYGPHGATLEEIQTEWAKTHGGNNLDQKQFIRMRKDILTLCGVEVLCRKAKFNSRYYVSGGGAKSFLLMSALNTFLLQNIIASPSFPKDRIYIDDSYNNDTVRTVSSAVARRRNIKVGMKKLEYEYVNVDGIAVPKKVSKIIVEFKFIPYALTFSTKWFMFGKKPGEDELLVYSMNNIDSISTGFDMGDTTAEFDLKEVLDNYRTYFPISQGVSFPDDRLDFHCSMRTSSFKLF